MQRLGESFSIPAENPAQKTPIIDQIKLSKFK
jgi:hypothetical protein